MYLVDIPLVPVRGREWVEREPSMGMNLNYPLTHYLYRPMSRPLAAALAGTPVTPTHLTWFSAVLVTGGAVAFGFRLYLLGVVLTLVGQIADCADGDLARITHKTSRSGAFLDSVLDRWTDAALILGLAFSNPPRYGVAAAFALVASFLVSYNRARGQSLGADCPEGIATRDARLLLVMLAALTGWILAGLWVVAVLGFITALQRMVWTIRALDTHDAETHSERDPI